MEVNTMKKNSTLKKLLAAALSLSLALTLAACTGAGNDSGQLWRFQFRWDRRGRKFRLCCKDGV